MFWTAYSAVYDRLWDQPLHHHAIEAAVRRLDPELPVREVGAGTGLATVHLVDCGFEVDASEPNAAMRRRFEARLPSVAVAGSIAGMADPSTSGPPEINVLAVNVLHLVDDPSAVLDRLRQQAGPSGRVVVVVPVIGTTLGGLFRAMRACGATRRQCARFVALQSLTAPLQAGARVQANDVNFRDEPGLVNLEVLNGVHRVAVFTGRPGSDRPADSAKLPTGPFNREVTTSWSMFGLCRGEHPI